MSDLHDAAAFSEPTLGEVFRTVRSIDQQARRTDERMAVLEKDVEVIKTRLEGHGVAIDDMKQSLQIPQQAVSQLTTLVQHALTQHGYRQPAQSDDAIRIPINGKVVTAMIAALGALVAAAILAMVGRSPL